MSLNCVHAHIHVCNTIYSMSSHSLRTQLRMDYASISIHTYNAHSHTYPRTYTYTHTNAQTHKNTKTQTHKRKQNTHTHNCMSMLAVEKRDEDRDLITSGLLIMCRSKNTADWRKAYCNSNQNKKKTTQNLHNKNTKHHRKSPHTATQKQKRTPDFDICTKGEEL